MKPGMVTSAVWSDATGDGWIDLLIALEWGPVSLFANKEGKRLENMTESSGIADQLGHRRKKNRLADVGGIAGAQGVDPAHFRYQAPDLANRKQDAYAQDEQDHRVQTRIGHEGDQDLAV